MEGWGCWVRRSRSVGNGITLQMGGQEITHSGQLWRARPKRPIEVEGLGHHLGKLSVHKKSGVHVHLQPPFQGKKQ